MTRYALILSIAAITSHAVMMYENATDSSNTIVEMNTEHQYEIEYSDWVKITDKETGKQGWAKLSELGDFFSHGTTMRKTNYQSVDGHSSYSEKMYYKPRVTSDPELIKKRQKIIQELHDENLKSMQRRAELREELSALDSPFNYF